MGYIVHGILQARILEWVAFPPPGDLPNRGIKPRSPTLQADSLPAEAQGNPKNAENPVYSHGLNGLFPDDAPQSLGLHSPLFSLHDRFLELLSVSRKSHACFYPSDFVLTVPFPPEFSRALSPLSDLKFSTVSAEAFLTVQYR